jgi:hypothetical protein
VSPGWWRDLVRIETLERIGTGITYCLGKKDRGMYCMHAVSEESKTSALSAFACRWPREA